MNKRELTTYIIMMLLFISVSLLIGLVIDTKGGPTHDFCSDHYKDDTFLSDFIGDVPHVLKTCCITQGESLGVDYCKEYIDDYQKCIVVNGTDDQRRFMNNCHWMGPDYFIMAGRMIFLFFIPLSIIVINIVMLYEWNKKRRITK